MFRLRKASNLWLSSFVLGAFFFASQVFAQAGPCEIHSSQDILSCVVSRHPDVMESEAAKARDQKLLDISLQRPNPEFETKITAGKDSGAAALKTETGFFPIWELGGKRKARLGQAQAAYEKSEVEVLAVRERLVLETVLSLHRLRQIGEERARASETLSTFGKMLASFRLRPQLTPEQEATKASFELGRQEYRLKEAALFQEESVLQFSLERATGLQVSEWKAYLPKGRPRFPDTPSGKADDSHSELASARNEVRSAEASVAAANSKAWPDLKIGPVLETESLSASTASVTGGLGISLPLPVVNRARGEKEYATLDRVRAEQKLADARRKADLEVQARQVSYERARAALRQGESFDQARALHDKIENSFNLGTVSGALVIEAHRQLYEILVSRDAQEIEALRALWSLYLLQGTFLQESI